MMSKTPASSWKQTTLEVVLVLARWGLAVEFIRMGLSKAMHPEYFIKLVDQYHLTTMPLLLNSIAATLPWFEVFCGVLLLTGVAVRGVALLLIGMLVPFTLVVLKRALEIASTTGMRFCAIKFDCGCGNGEVLICHKLVENSLWILLACLLLTNHGRRLCARFALLKTASSQRA